MSCIDKREIRAEKKVNRQGFHFLTSSTFIKKKTFQKKPLFLSSGKAAPNVGEPRSNYFITGHLTNSKLVITIDLVKQYKQENGY